jgi:ABC-type transport system involved in multi-copper enzyme maturation permease subunit
MSAVLTPPPAAPAGPFGGLLRAEVHRFLARRFIRVLLGAALAGWVLAGVLSLLAFESPTAERLEAARQQQQEEVQRANEVREQCLADPARPSDVPADGWCGPPATEDTVPLSAFLQPPPFSLAGEATEGAVAVAAVAAALAFLVGATYVGAEWSTRSMVALLFWETRRGRVLGAKVLVAVVASAALGLLMQAAWLGLATLLQTAAGDGAPPPDGFWSELLGVQGRGVLLTVFAGLLGFGLSNLLRNTGAATGVAFVYVAIVENAVRALRPAWQPELLTNNAAALVLPEGLTLYLPGSAVDGAGSPTGGVEHLLGNGSAAVYLTVVTAALIGAGVVLFRRRDLH